MRNALLLLTLAACSPAKGAGPATTEMTLVDEAASSAPETEPPTPEPAAAITGRVRMAGEVLEMHVPKKRAEAEFCKDIELPHNAIVVQDGYLKDVWVGIDNEQVRGDHAIPGPTVLDRKDCQFGARVVGLVPGQEIQFTNSDPTFHNLWARLGNKTLFNLAHPNGAPPAKKTLEDLGIYRLGCDVHSWEHGFLIVTDNPFGDVTKEDGAYRIPDVPDGEYTLVAWHSFFGKKTAKIKVLGHQAAQDFSYVGDEEEPPENMGELDDLF